MAAAKPGLSRALVLATTVPMTVDVTSPPAPPLKVGLRSARQHLHHLLHWILFVYVPLAFLATAVPIAGLTVFKIANNPDIMVDATLDAAISFMCAEPRCVWAAGRKLAAAMFNKIFGTAPLAKPAAKCPAIGFMEQEMDANTAWGFFLVQTALGYSLSAYPPAQPTCEWVELRAAFCVAS